PEEAGLRTPPPADARQPLQPSRPGRGALRDAGDDPPLLHRRPARGDRRPDPRAGARGSDGHELHPAVRPAVPDDRGLRTQGDGAAMTGRNDEREERMRTDELAPATLSMRPFVPSRDFGESRRFYEALGF